MFCLRSSVLKRVRMLLTRHNAAYIGASLRNASFSKRAPKMPKEFNVSEHQVIYSFPNLPILAGIVKLKNFKLVLFTGAFVFSLIVAERESVGLHYLIGGAFFYAVLIAIILSYSYIFHNIIGKLYVLQKSIKLNKIDQVVISYLDKKGNRINILKPCEHVQVTDHPNILFRKFLKQVTVKDTDEKLHLLHYQDVGIIDFVSFYKVFKSLGINE